jgi:Ca-activated chloride channel family protein
MFRFENTIWLYALVLIPCMLIAFRMVRKWKKNARQKMGDAALVGLLVPNTSHRKPAIKLALYLLAFTLLVVGLANPQLGSKLEEAKREGVDIIVAIDVSNSMRAEDIAPNRLERTKLAIEKLIGKLHNDRIGLIVFAGEAFVQLPITSDYAAAKLFSSTISNELVPTQGTAIGAAIHEAESALDKDDSKQKALIIITDGENHEDDALEAVKGIAEKGVTVHAVGMGSVKGGPIPIYRNGIRSGYRTDREGNTVVSRLNQEMLQQLATAGNGLYVRASNANDGLSTIMNEINKMEKTEFESKVYTDYEDRFQPFLLTALLLLLIEFFIPATRSKWLKNIHLFDSKQ